MSVRKALVSAALVLMVGALAPAKASADWMFTPWIGWNFGGSATFNDSIGDFEDEFEKRVSYGASLSWMGAGVVGFEVDFGWAPNFFQPTEGDENFDYGDSNLTTLMGNVILGIPIGGQTGFGIRPYVSGGLGIMAARADGAQDFLGELDRNEWGYNVGGGITGFFTDKIGMRGDIRYFRQLRDADFDEDDVFDVGVGDLRFWRGSVGVVFRF
jgi:Outer membrane protein beta-barrel domain